MRSLLITLCIVMLSAGLAFAQDGAIGVFSDPTASSCNLDDAPAGGLCVLAIVHAYHGGATGSQFKATKPECFPATYLSDGQIFSVTVGNSQTGVAIGYPGCEAAPTHILNMQFLCTGATTPCCEWWITGDPALPSGLVEGSDCVFGLTHPTAGMSIVNSDGVTCVCERVPTQETTWGKVKALFAE